MLLELLLQMRSFENHIQIDIKGCKGDVLQILEGWQV